MKRLVTIAFHVALPLAVVVLAAAGAYAIYLNRPDVPVEPRTIDLPSVRVQEVRLERRRLTVKSQGTVRPRTESQLVPEISGRVVWVSPSFASGGFFETGEPLLRIDAYDYEQALIGARAQLAQARLRLAQEEAESAVAAKEWRELGSGDPQALTLREPQLADARAAVAAAEAALDRAERDLERAEIDAPYAGRVRSKNVDVGQFVTRGNAVATLYAVETAEVRLPLPDGELAFLDLPLSYRGRTQRPGPRVTLRAEFAGREHTWSGRIVRTESEIDPVSRMVHVVAEVEDPYAAGSDPRRPPLASGMYVQAEIEGREVDDLVALPWSAMRAGNQVLVVDADARLHVRPVEVLRSNPDEVLIGSGLADGELVCLSPLDVVTDGMQVNLVERLAPAEESRP